MVKLLPIFEDTSFHQQYVGETKCLHSNSSRIRSSRSSNSSSRIRSSRSSSYFDPRPVRINFSVLVRSSFNFGSRPVFFWRVNGTRPENGPRPVDEIFCKRHFYLI